MGEISASRAAERLAGLRLVALTGAGISVPSGIPDFRSAGGLWERWDPMTYAHIASFQADPVEVWRMLIELYQVCDGAEPNAAHHALAGLEGQGTLTGVVTQNIDGLHRRGGSHDVVAFHGSGELLRCLGCGATTAWIPGTPPAPRCGVCDAVLKPDIVFFGEQIPAAAVAGAARMLQDAQGVLVIGTSAEVWPASELPVRAHARGLPVIEFNLERTPLAEQLGLDTVLGDVVDTLPAFVDALTQRAS